MRYEIKYQIPLVDRYMVEQAILSHPASFCTAFPNRIVNNIYFDSPDLKSFYQNVDGDPERQKVRFRWYDDQALSTGKLEIKKKKGALGLKEYPAISFTTEAKLLQSVMAATNISVEKQLINQYRRSYYVSLDQKFRITLDEEIKYINPNFSNIQDVEDDLILEIKFEEEDYILFSRIHDFLPFRQTKYSKYVSGIIKTKT